MIYFHLRYRPVSSFSISITNANFICNVQMEHVTHLRPISVESHWTKRRPRIPWGDHAHVLTLRSPPPGNEEVEICCAVHGYRNCLEASSREYVMSAHKRCPQTVSTKKGDGIVSEVVKRFLQHTYMLVCIVLFIWMRVSRDWVFCIKIELATFCSLDKVILSSIITVDMHSLEVASLPSIVLPAFLDFITSWEYQFLLVFWFFLFGCVSKNL